MMRGLRGWSVAGAAAVVAVGALLAGCASVLPFDESLSYKCFDDTIDASVLAERTPIADLPADQAAMVAEATWDDGSPLVLDDEESWYFAGMSDGDLMIMRDIEPGSVDGGLPNSDHEIIKIHRIDDSPNVEPGWYVWANSVCPLTIDLGGLDVPTVSLDPAHAPDPSSSELALLVTEVECNSGQPADGRVKVVSLVETSESVTVTIGIEPNSGNQTCPSNPATPFVVQLDSPIGDRTLIDGTRGAPLADPVPFP